MIGFIIRIALTATVLGFNVWLFATGHWGWGITVIFITALLIASFFRNEKMIWALYQMQKGLSIKLHTLSFYREGSMLMCCIYRHS